MRTARRLAQRQSLAVRRARLQQARHVGRDRCAGGLERRARPLVERLLGLLRAEYRAVALERVSSPAQALRHTALRRPGLRGLLYPAGRLGEQLAQLRSELAGA